MTVSVQDPLIVYTGNNVTREFAVPFRIIVADDLKASLAGAPTTAFSIDGIGEEECSITFTAAPAAGVQIIIFRQVTLDRVTDYQDNGDLLAATLNPDFDRLWMAMQDAALSAGKVLQVPISDPTPSVLPTAAVRANKALVFGPDGDVGLSANNYLDQTAEVEQLIVQATEQATNSASSATASAGSATASATSAAAAAASAAAAAESELHVGSNGWGNRTVSTNAPSGGADGDLWYQV